MRYVSFCSGVEAATLAWHGLGWEPIAFSEIEPFPCAVLAERFPNIPNLGDCTKIHYNRETQELYTQEDDGTITKTIPAGKVDLCVGGFPCFVAGTMVLTPKGYVPIETLKVGDEVVTHDGNVRRVLATGHHEAEIGKANILSRPPIVCTPNHPFFSMKLKRDNDRKSYTYQELVPDGWYEFKAISESVGRYAAHVYPMGYGGEVPLNIYKATRSDVMSLAGWYLGDGYIRRYKGKNKKGVVLALICSEKIEKFKQEFGNRVNYTVSKSDGKIIISCTVLADWLIENFGEYSHEKRIPYWCYSDVHSDALIRGYTATDGCQYKGVTQFATTSPTLAYGIADLLREATVCFHKVAPTTIIEGRVVHQKNQYVVRRSPKSYTKWRGGYHASKIKSWEPSGTTGTVYNITVDGEHTYVVEGFAVHNCQSFSNAGKRLGLEGASGLIKEYFRLLAEMRPEWFVYENVPGMLSSNHGRDFRFILRCFDEVGYSCAWRVLDAQYTRVPDFPRAIPQRRRRVFVVGHLGADWRCAAEVLLEPTGLFGSAPPRRVKGKGFAPGVESRTGIASASALIDREGKPGGGKGLLIGNERMHTLATTNNQSVFVVDSNNSNSMKSANPTSGFHPASVSPTLDTTTPAPNKAQGGQMVCEKCYPINGMIIGPGAKSANHSYGIAEEGEPLPTISTMHHHAVAVVDDQGGGVISVMGEEIAPTLRREMRHHEPLVMHGDVKGYENHPNDSRVTESDGAFTTITARAGTGGNNLPLVMEQKGVDNYNLQITGDVSQTIRAKTADSEHVPCVMEQKEQVCEEIVGALCACDSKMIQNQTVDDGKYVIVKGTHQQAYENHPQDARAKPTEVAPTLGTYGNAQEGKDALVMMWDNQSNARNPSKCEGVACTLQAAVGESGTHSPLVSETFPLKNKDALVNEATIYHTSHGSFLMKWDANQVVDPLLATDYKDPPAIAIATEPTTFPIEGNGQRPSHRGGGYGQATDPQFTLNHTEVHGVANRNAVRRITPTEAERLMGFPRDWTKIPWKGKSADECPDGPRYKACGNSMCVNVMQWIGMRIELTEQQIQGEKK